MDATFWSRIDLTACWLWTGTQTHNGYGRIKVKGIFKKAHRHVYEELVGPIGAGLTLDHLCRVRLCVNPTHLEPVTLAENLRRGIVARLGREPLPRRLPAIPRSDLECRRGHPYSLENTRFRPGKGRDCKLCQRIRQTRVAA